MDGNAAHALTRHGEQGRDAEAAIGPQEHVDVRIHVRYEEEFGCRVRNSESRKERTVQENGLVDAFLKVANGEPRLGWR